MILIPNSFPIDFGTPRTRRNRCRQAPPCSAAFGVADGPPATYRRRRRQIRAPHVQTRPTPPEPCPGLPCIAAGVRVAAAAAPPAGDVIVTSPRWAWAGTGPAVGPACVLAACVSLFFLFFLFSLHLYFHKFSKLLQYKKKLLTNISKVISPTKQVMMKDNKKEYSIFVAI